MTDSSQFEAWQEILIGWQKVNRMKRLIQELYDQVGGTLFYLLDYAKKNDIVLQIVGQNDEIGLVFHHFSVLHFSIC